MSTNETEMIELTERAQDHTMNTLMIAATLLVGLDDAPKKSKPLPARPAALVLTVKGEVTAQGKLGKHRVEQGDFLLPGQMLTAAADAEAVMVFLVKGERRKLKPGARATMTRDGCDPADATERLGAARLPRKNLTMVREIEVGESGGVGTLRAPPSTTEARVTPLFGTFVMTDRPAFTWPPADRAEGYVLELKDAAGRKLWQASVKEPKLDYPAKEKPLSAEAPKFLWTVKAKLPDGDEKVVVDESNFKVLFKGEGEALAPVRKLADSDDPADLLLAAATYEGYRIYDEALKLFEKLAQKQPKVARYHEALARYYRHAGRLDKAREAQEQANKLRGVRQ
jgi:hypothetical protein